MFLLVVAGCEGPVWCLGEGRYDKTNDPVYQGGYMKGDTFVLQTDVSYFHWGDIDFLRSSDGQPRGSKTLRAETQVEVTKIAFREAIGYSGTEVFAKVLDAEHAGDCVCLNDLSTWRKVFTSLDPNPGYLRLVMRNGIPVKTEAK